MLPNQRTASLALTAITLLATTTHRKNKSVDDVARGEGVEALSLVEVPEHGSSVLAARGAERSIRRYGDGVEVSGVSDEVGAELKVGERPHLDELVPAGRDDDLELVRGREAHAGDPVVVGLVDDGVLALAKGVPQLDGLVARSRDDLAVVGAEGDREDILLVARERLRAPLLLASLVLGALASGEVPEGESSVPGSRHAELAVAGERDVLDRVRVAAERPAAGALDLSLTGEVPDLDRLVAGRGQELVAVHERVDSRDPTIVGRDLAEEGKLLARHDLRFVACCCRK